LSTLFFVLGFSLVFIAIGITAHKLIALMPGGRQPAPRLFAGRCFRLWLDPVRGPDPGRYSGPCRVPG
jgi:cytochrome c biogenesis protein CcdA